jgi:hypothetical protein
MKVSVQWWRLYPPTLAQYHVVTVELRVKATSDEEAQGIAAAMLEELRDDRYNDEETGEPWLDNWDYDDAEVFIDTNQEPTR